MTDRHQIYKCETCGNIVEVLHAGAGELVCCGRPMKLFEEKTVGELREKHVPVLEQDAAGSRVVVGEVPHPMEREHCIEWIQIIMKDGTSVRKFLTPGGTPDARFCESASSARAGEVREYCSVHGLWKA